MDDYPKLPEGAAFSLSIILRLMAADPEFLTHSPYSLEEVEMLEAFASAAATAEEVEAVEPRNKWELLEQESDLLFKGLTEAGKNMHSKADNEKMAYFRTATSLLEKIVGIQERAANLRQIHAFHQTVMEIMESVLEPGQRTEVSARLRAAIAPEVTT